MPTIQTKSQVNGFSKTPIQPTVNDSDDDTEDEQRSSPKKKNEGPQPQAEEFIKKKKARFVKPLSEEMLCAPDGLLRIYEEFPKACPFRGRGSEAKDLKRLTTLYKEWAFQLHPGIAYQDFLVKCESLGSKVTMRNRLEMLRDRERDRYVTEVMGIKISRNEEPHESASEDAPMIATQEATSEDLALIRMLEEIEAQQGGSAPTESVAGPVKGTNLPVSKSSEAVAAAEDEEAEYDWLDEQ